MHGKTRNMTSIVSGSPLSGFLTRPASAGPSLDVLIQQSRADDALDRQAALLLLNIHNRAGEAMKIELYVPTSTPTTKANAKP